MREAQEKVNRLILSFPCLRTKLSHYEFEDFDPQLLWDASEMWSSGERLSLAFCLNVWTANNHAKPWHPFDVLEFLAVADSGNKAALVSWILKPFWP